MVCAFGADRQMKGEYLIMNNVCLRRIFSLLLAVMMVCALLPTAAFAEDIAEPQNENGGQAAYANNSVPLELRISSYGAPFYNPTKKTHDVNSYRFCEYIQRSDVGSDNPKDCSATAHFVGNNETGWQLYVKVKLDNYEADFPQNAWIYNKDMSAATGYITFGLSFNTPGGTSTNIHIDGAKDLPKPSQPDKPGKPTEDYIINNQILGDVTIECTNADVQHGSRSYPLTEESITSITEPDFDSNAGQYSCMVTVSSTSYVHQFDHDKGGVHTPDDKTKTIQLLYYADAWHGPSGDPSVSSILFKVKCTEKPEPPKAPDAPGYEDLKNLIGDITVNCTNGAATHTPKSKGYALIADSYTPGKVEGDADNGYTYTVTISPEKYVNAFSKDTTVPHTTQDGNATVVLEYEDNAWAVKSGTPVSFNVACVTEIVPPTKPTLDELRKLLGQVTVDCINAKANHPDGKYDLIEDSYIANIQEQNGTYVCMVSVYADKYVAKYNETYSGHSLAGSADSDKVKLVYLRAAKTDTGYTPWSVSDAEPLTFTVKCSTEITPPPAPTFERLPEIKVTVDCVTTAEHKDATLLLMKDSYEVGKVELKNDVYTCVLTVKAEKYVDEYSGGGYRGGKHELDDDAAKAITLTWDGQKWTAEKNSVTFKVKCRLCTVIYEDGVKGKAFNTKKYPNLPYGSDTPKFEGTPKRTGYTFTGWSPKVTDTVTGDVTYKAQWKSTKNGKDRVPKTGDGETVMVLGSVLLFSFCGAAAVCVYDRKRRQG